MLLLLLHASPAAVLVPSRQRLGVSAATVRTAPSAPAKAVARAVAFVAAARQIRRPVAVTRAAKSANRAGLRNTRKPTP